MTSVTSPQQTDRRGTDEIPAPRSGQGVRLLVLGADPDAQTLRDQAVAAGFELAQRYSARVSHVAYGTGVDPGDARYTKIRDAGLVLLPLQKCAEQLGLGTEETDAADATATATADTTEAAEAVKAGTDAAVEAAIEAEFDGDVEDAADDGAPLEIPPLRPVGETIDVAEVEETADVEDTTEVEDSAEIEDTVEGGSAIDFVPGFSDDSDDRSGLPLAAAVIGADPWIGGAGGPADVANSSEDVTEIPRVEASEPAAAVGNVVGNVVDHSVADAVGHPARRLLLSIVWALIPFATFGLLAPLTFGYAAYRLRSRALVLAAMGYTIAVVASFVLSAARPHAATPSDAAGALLTLCLAGSWIGGTLHAVGIRTRVFAR